MEQTFHIFLLHQLRYEFLVVVDSLWPCLTGQAPGVVLCSTRNPILHCRSAHLQELACACACPFRSYSFHAWGLLVWHQNGFVFKFRFCRVFKMVLFSSFVSTAVILSNHDLGIVIWYVCLVKSDAHCCKSKEH